MNAIMRDMMFIFIIASSVELIVCNNVTFLRKDIILITPELQTHFTTLDLPIPSLTLTDFSLLLGILKMTISL